uniref:Minor capsid protein P11 C-terminal conserved region domain-containing protein n=1 Tax=viral metagenome TaxID=1070528 RepID=A0A6C0KZI3_9ZZZZ|tara:strand:+ start:158 stop:769 length:612 start_codon:yes stop_codon:yes gene_type:complete
MDCQKLIVYGILGLVSLYLLKDICGIKFPFIEGYENESEGSPALTAAPSAVAETPTPPVVNETPPVVDTPVVDGALQDKGAPVQGIKTSPGACYPQNSLSPSDLLPESESAEIKEFNEKNPEGEGILKGVNYLDAGFHVGVNTIGQSLRNANRNLREEPPNPRVVVSPWSNSTIDPDLSRKPLSGCGSNMGGPAPVPNGVEAN